MSPLRRRQRPLRAARRPAPARAGMTLVEVIVAITILSGVLLGMAVFVANFSRANNDNRLRAKAGQLAAQRLEEIKGAANYDSLETKYQKTETGLAGYSGFTRQTIIKRVGGTTSTSDYKVITVVVSAPRLKTAMKKTTMVSSF